MASQPGQRANEPADEFIYGTGPEISGHPMSSAAPDSTTGWVGLDLLDDGGMSLVDLLDRLLAGGVVLSGEITISISGVDLLQLSLQALLTSIRTDKEGDDGSG